MPHHTQRLQKGRLWSNGNRREYDTEARVKVAASMLRMVTCIMSVAIAAVDTSGKPKGKPALVRRRIKWVEHARISVEAGTFQQEYRMTLSSFRKLVCLLRPLLAEDEDSAIPRSASGEISVETRVAIAIRLLAGASHRALMDTFGVSKAAIYECLWNTVDAINRTRGVGDMGFPQDTEACRKLATAFEERSPTCGCMHGVVGAVGGLFVKTRVPAITEDLNQMKYYSEQRKAFGLNVQAIAAADGRFIGVSIMYSGSTDDFCAFSGSQAWEVTRSLPDGFFLVGDAAYPLDEHLLTPYPGERLRKDYDVFNFYLSQTRRVVERSFGILVQTWGILWKPLEVTFAGRADVINAIFRLHNFLCDEGEDLANVTEDVESRGSGAPQVDSDGILPDDYKTEKPDEPNNNGEVQRRADIRQAMAVLGLKRPGDSISRREDVG